MLLFLLLQMKPNLPTSPSIAFHIVEDKIFPTKNFKVKFDLYPSKIIEMNKKFFIDKKYFGKLKDKIKTNIHIFTDKNEIKFLITLYYGENHITIYKSNNIGACFEIIQMYLDMKENRLNKIDFIDTKNNVISVVNYDTIGNLFRRRFLAVNFPINIKLNINNLNKMKKNESYKINLLKNDIIVQENRESPKNEKIEIKNINDMKKINIEIDTLIENKDVNKLKDIIKKLSPYDDYFNQYLINKREYNWNSDEFVSYYHYFKFKIYLLSISVSYYRKVEYYQSALKIFTNIYNQLNKIKNVNFYEKICAITSLYRKFKSDAESKENKNYGIGEYKLLNMNGENKIKCYNLVYEFITNIINKMKEKSFIFLLLLQVNSSFSENINSIDKKDIFELSIINVNMVKEHLKILMPKILFTIKHPNIELRRGTTDKMTGNIFIYESSIFRNNLGKSIDEIILNQPENAAVIISFVIMHEIFMHKKLRSNPDYIKGRETPSKFIDPKLNIKNFYFSQDIHNLDPLSVYNENKIINKIPEDGECGRILEYFFDNEKFEIIYYLKNYLGFGDLLKNVDLVVDENLNRLHSYVKQKISEGKVQLLYKEKNSKINIKKYISDESDGSEKGRKFNDEGEEEEEEEEEESELSEETKEILK